MHPPRYRTITHLVKRQLPHAVRAVGRFGLSVADELFPRICDAELAQYREEGWAVDQPSQYCSRCGATAGPYGYTPEGCAFCRRQPVAWDGIYRLAAYEPPVCDWVRAMKFQRVWSWAPWFGQTLAQCIDPCPSEDRVLVCPVPMHWLRRLSRGYNQAYLIAKAMAQAHGWPVVNLLKRSRYTPPQTSVPISYRPANLRGSLDIRPVDLTGWSIWLVDDVKTTGATLNACARLLRRAKARSVYAAVASVADPHHQDFTAIVPVKA